MAEVDDGGPAFPFPGIPTDGTDIPWMMPPFPGMSLRDWFAGMAMQGVIADSGWEPIVRSDGITPVSEVAYAIADAMLAARKEQLNQEDAQ